VGWGWVGVGGWVVGGGLLGEWVGELWGLEAEGGALRMGTTPVCVCAVTTPYARTREKKKKEEDTWGVVEMGWRGGGGGRRMHASYMHDGLWLARSCD
jgi:hypothetical protein